MTIALWVRPASPLLSWARIFDFGNAGGADVIRLYTANDGGDHYYFSVNNGDGDLIASKRKWKRVNTGEWQYFVITITTQMITLYHDYARPQLVSITGPLSAASTVREKYYLGVSRASPFKPLHGDI